MEIRFFKLQEPGIIGNSQELCGPTLVQACLLNKKKLENVLTRFRTQARSDMQLEPNHSTKLASCCSTITKKIPEVNLTQFYFILFYKKQLNTILFYLVKLSISYKEYKKIIIKILQRYSTLLQKLIINFNVFMVIILFY